MLTLSDINTLTNSKDGDLFSDLFKDVCGFRPRGTLAQFESLDAFDAEYKRLAQELSRQLDEDRVRQAANVDKFFERVSETMQLCSCDQVRAIEIIADAEGEAEEFKWYGYERLEWHFNLPYGSIKQVIEGKF